MIATVSTCMKSDPLVREHNSESCGRIGMIFQGRHSFGLFDSLLIMNIPPRERALLPPEQPFVTHLVLSLAHRLFGATIRVERTSQYKAANLGDAKWFGRGIFIVISSCMNYSKSIWLINRHGNGKFSSGRSCRKLKRMTSQEVPDTPLFLLIPFDVKMPNLAR